MSTARTDPGVPPILTVGWGKIGLRPRGSQASPTPFRSASAWEGLAVSGQLSQALPTPSPSVSRLLPDSKRSEEHTSELQSRLHLVCRLLLEKKKKKNSMRTYRIT